MQIIDLLYFHSFIYKKQSKYKIAFFYMQEAYRIAEQLQASNVILYCDREEKKSSPPPLQSIPDLSGRRQGLPLSCY